MGWGPISGGIGGSRSTFDAGSFADLDALNTWGAANLGSLFNNNERFTIATIGSGVVFEWAGEDTPSSYPAGGNWVLRFQAGGDGIPPFESEGARDVFFGTPGNEALIKTGLPVEVNIGSNGTPTVTNFVWTGPNNPQDYISNDPRWQVAQFRVSNGTIFVGPGMQISNGVQALGLIKPTGQKALSLQLEYDDTGSRRPFYPQLGEEVPLVVNTVGDRNMPDPYELNYTTFGNNLTNDFTFRPAEAGNIRLRYWLGTDDTGVLIFDERRVVTPDEVDTDIPFGIGNAYLLAQGTQLFVRSEGVALRGTLVNDPSSPFNGQNLLVFTSMIQPYTEVDLMSDGDASRPVEVGRDFRFSDGELNYNGLVFNVKENVQSISFGDGTLDIPSVDGAPYHVIGAHLVLEYDEGFAFARVTGTTSSGGVGDIEAALLGSVAFADGDEFTLPNVANDVHLGVMQSTLDPDTEVAFENIRASSGQVLGSDFSHPPYNNAREVTFTLQNEFEVDYAIANLFIPNKTAIGPAIGSANDAGVITSAIKNPSNNLQVIVDLTTGITLGSSNLPSGDVEVYDVTTENIRHIVVQSGATARVQNGTLELLPGMTPGEDGIEYQGDTPDDNELIAGTGNSNLAKGTGITLNSIGRIPFENIGEADITLSGSGGSLTIDVNNIDQYKNRTIFINHSNTFTLNLDDIDDFHDADEPTFFLRFVQLTDRLLGIQGITGQTIGGLTQQRLRKDGSLTIELPAEGQTNWPVLAAGNPLRRFDILQITSNTTYGDDAALEFICDHLLEVDGENVELSFAPSTLDCAFWVHNQGSSAVSIIGISGATIDGVTTLEPDDLVWVWNIAASNTYRSVRISGKELHTMQITTSSVEEKIYPVTISVPFDGVLVSSSLWHPNDSGQVSGSFMRNGSTEFSQSTTTNDASITPRNISVEAGDNIAFDVISVNSVSGPMTIEITIRKI